MGAQVIVHGLSQLGYKSVRTKRFEANRVGASMHTCHINFMKILQEGCGESAVLLRFVYNICRPDVSIVECLFETRCHGSHYTVRQ